MSNETKPTSTGTPNLAKSCVVFKLNIKLYTGNKTIALLGEEIARKHGGEADAMKGSTSALDKEDRLSIQRISLNARAYLKENSLTWDDNGARLVEARNYQAVYDKLTHYKRAFDAAVKKCAGRWDELRDRAKERVGDLFDYVQFPASKEAFASEYSFEFTPELLSDSSQDIRIAGLNKDQAAQFSALAEKKYEKRVEAVKIELVRRIEKVVLNVSEAMKEEGKIFRDSLFENVKTLAEIGPSLNVTRDPKIAKALDSLKKLGEHKGEEVRVPEVKAKTAEKKAEQKAEVTKAKEARVTVSKEAEDIAAALRTFDGV